MIRNVFCIAASFALVLSSARADATPNFPPAIQSHLVATQAPDCSVCHVGGQTARGTVNTPFGTLMRSRGLAAYDEGSLRTALDAIAAEKKDSDRDGAVDTEELRIGGNPNVATAADGGVVAEPLVPEYGCNAAPFGPAVPGWGGGLWVLLALTRRVQRSRSRPRGLSPAWGK